VWKCAVWLFLLALRICEGIPFPGCKGGTLEGCPGTANCSVHYLDQLIDHFNWAAPLGNEQKTTFRQRYFVNDQWWRTNQDGSRGPIFFYFGNEDNVELYVNHTGLMWENAAELGARLIFAEHRYYGESLPFPAGTQGCMNWLTSEQAMADFAYLIDYLQSTLSGGRVPVIGFGGSYGGMIGAWFRVKYPNSVDGVIAASAPIWSFKGLSPPYNFNAFAQGVTFDASAAGGASDFCKENIKNGYFRILAAGQSAKGLALLHKAFRTCSPLRPGTNDVSEVANFFSSGGNFANMAMGNYPYASTYLMHGKSLLPPWPVRVACSHLSRQFGPDEDALLFEGLREATAVQQNNTGDKVCFDVTGLAQLQQPLEHLKMGMMSTRAIVRDQIVHDNSCQGTWGYQYCTEMTQPFTTGTIDDMYFCPNGTFFPAENCSDTSRWDEASVAANCVRSWGTRPRTEWARIGLGGKRIQAVSNIIFSNGALDPWHGGGVLKNLSDTIIALVIPNGAHHIDLMFTDPADAAYPDIAAARATELREIRRWVMESQEQHKKGQIA